MRQRKLTLVEQRTVASHARLAQNDWNDLTRAANASPNHVSSLDRWRRKARELNPALSDAQVDRLAQTLKRDFYRANGRKSGEARRARSAA